MTTRLLGNYWLGRKKSAMVDGCPALRDGALQIIDLGGYGSGTYTLITYSGSLNDESLELTAMPDGFNAFLDTSNAGQVNLAVEPLSDGIFSDRFEP